MGQRKPKILLLDDDPFHRGLLAEGLEDYYDFLVTRVENLSGAKQAIVEIEPDILVLDLVLGDDRFGVLQWVKGLRQGGDFKNTPVLFVTAYFREMEEHVRSIEDSVILEKPFKFEEVTQKIRKLLSQSK